jgi:hypothetical protein
MWDPTATTTASLSPVASSRELRRANASDDDDPAEAFAVIEVIVIVANEQQRWWLLIAARWDLTIALAPGGKICGEGTRKMMTSPPPYDSSPSEKRGTRDTTTAAPPPLPIPPVAVDNQCPRRPRINGDDNDDANNGKKPRRSLPASQSRRSLSLTCSRASQANHYLDWHIADKTNHLRCASSRPPIVPLSPRTLCCRRRCQPPPPGRRRPSSPPPSPLPPSILLLHLPLPGIKLVARQRCRIFTMKAQRPFICTCPVDCRL